MTTPSNASRPQAQQPQQPQGKQRRPVSVGQILGGLLFVLTVIFILENTKSVKVRLIIPEVNAPLAVPIVIAAVLGAMVAWLLRYRRRKHHLHD
jgi:uncharacterized integral membrane protein